MPSDFTGLPHGGDLDRARRRYPEVRDWVDLSTGINPWPYPVDALAPVLWHRLPDRDLLAALAGAATRRYDAPAGARVVCAPGAQAIVQALPRLRPPGRVAVVGFGYREHARCWRLAGHAVTEEITLDAAADRADVVVVVHPNNPDGRLHPHADLERAAARLAARGGWLVVDEAFVDPVPERSLASASDRPGLWVLRSFGKFYGLAGLRLGFALAPRVLARRLAEALGPWAVSGPAAAIGHRALADTAWATATRARLAGETARTRALLADAGLAPVGGTDLFTLVETPGAAALAETLARRGLLVRAFAERPRWLRLGLPPDDDARARLASALAGGERRVHA